MAIDLVQNSKDAEIAQLKAELEEIKSQPAPQPQAEMPPQGSAFEKQKDENCDLIQQELDTFEEYIIDNMFPNGIKVNSFVKTYLTMKGKTEVDVINESILAFEKAVRPFMSPDGNIILTGKPSELIRLAQPLLEKFGKAIGG